jgi:hypothetical protein
MADSTTSDDEANAINDSMAQQIDRRRNERPERKRVVVKRRPTCEYCFQRGDHRTANQCLNALNRRT